MRAWFAGDFEGCLAICERVRTRGRESSAQLQLLRARALLRIASYRRSAATEAEDAARNALRLDASLDARVSAKMLVAASRIRRDDYRNALDLLADAKRDAVDAHRTIRSEIALNTALAFYGIRDLSAAEDALVDVDVESDIVFARCLEYRAWIATVRGRYDESAALFEAAIEHHRRCVHEDRFLLASCLSGWATIAFEQMDLESWARIEVWTASVDWESSGLGFHRFRLAVFAAGMYEISGDPLRAYTAAREAESLAPSPAYRIVARCTRATVARDVGETFSYVDHVLTAKRMRDDMGPNASATGEEAFMPVVLARELAGVGDVSAAREVMRLYREAFNSSGMLALSSGDDRLEAFESLTEAAIAEASGDLSSAERAYRSAFTTFAAHGYTRQAATAAVWLGVFAGDAAASDYADRVTRRVSSLFWIRRQLNAREGVDAIVGSLTRVEREILASVYEGMTNPAIAKERGRSVATVRNAIHRIFMKFGVKARAALIRECTTRRIFPLSQSR